LNALKIIALSFIHSFMSWWRWSRYRKTSCPWWTLQRTRSEWMINGNGVTDVTATVKLIGCWQVHVTSSCALNGRLQCCTQHVTC